METLYDFGLETVRWLQITYPQLVEFFTIISEVGRFEFYLAVLPFVYWCLDKRLGLLLTYLLALSDLLNASLKHVFREPRPYWLDETVGLGTEASYGIPSGHTQAATVAYIFLATWFRQRWVWLLALLIVLLMTLSRIYLGVHFVHDAIAGIVLGILIIIGYYLWRRYLDNWFRKRILGQRMLVAVSIPLLIAAVYLIIVLLIGRPDLQVPWAEHVLPAERESIESVAAAFGILLGVGTGFVLEGSRVRFLVEGPFWKRMLRYIIGIIVVLAIWRGLGMVFPRDPLWLAIPLRVLRYFLLGLWAAYYAPMLFVRLRLANAQPEPGIDLTI